MFIVIREDYKSLSDYAAKTVAGLVKQKPNCVIGLATGSTPIGTYRRLIEMHKEGLDFSKVVTFNLDEYLGLGADFSKPYDEDQSYARFMHEEFFKHVNVKKENIHMPCGLAKDFKKYCASYEEEIRKSGGIDLQILGLGVDGHWGFNEPGSSLGSRTRVVALTKQTLDDNYESFYKKAGVPRGEMPHFAITMGIGTILEARAVLMLVSGLKKAEIVSKCLEGPITAQVTSSAIQMHPGDITVVLDEAAASKLKNYDHYKFVQEAAQKFRV